MLAVGAAGGVAVHAAIASPSATFTASTATPSPSNHAGGGRECLPPKLMSIANKVLDVAAGVTGQSRDQILAQLRAGKTLDQIAGDKASAIESQVLATLKSRLDERVGAGRLSADAETKLLAAAKTALEKAMSSDLSSRIPAAGAGRAACGPRAERGLMRTLVKVTAEKTGLSEQQVRQELRDGKSIDQIAGDKAQAVKDEVMKIEQQRMSTLLDRLMSRTGRSDGHGAGRGAAGGTLSEDDLGV
jgi:hypothetical protein